MKREKTGVDTTIKTLSMKKLFTPRNGVILLVVLLLASMGTGIYFYKKATTDPKVAAQKDLQDTVRAVGKLIVLPTNETPTMATVSDPEKLKDQIFFQHASKGDKVLIYTVAGKAILYNPSTNKIVEVSPINLPQ
jgi:hypothetical protein